MYNHALTVAYEVVTPHDADSLTFEECLQALKDRVQQIEDDHDEEALLAELPFDTYETDE